MSVRSAGNDYADQLRWLALPADRIAAVDPQATVDHLGTSDERSNGIGTSAHRRGRSNEPVLARIAAAG